jgi:hypothetical protein
MSSFPKTADQNVTGSKVGRRDPRQFTVAQCMSYRSGSHPFDFEAGAAGVAGVHLASVRQVQELPRIE